MEISAGDNQDHFTRQEKVLDLINEAHDAFFPTKYVPAEKFEQALQLLSQAVQILKDIGRSQEASEMIELIERSRTVGYGQLNEEQLREIRIKLDDLTSRLAIDSGE